MPASGGAAAFPGRFDALRALFINCTLKRSPELNHTQGPRSGSTWSCSRARRARVVSVPTLIGQLDRLLAVIGLPTLELGIIPFEAAVPVFPLSRFRLYDDLVIVESIVGEQQLAEADDIARYEKYLELLRDVASTGTEAAAVIRRSLESLQ